MVCLEFIFDLWLTSARFNLTISLGHFAILGGHGRACNFMLLNATILHVKHVNGLLSSVRM